MDNLALVPFGHSMTGPATAGNTAAGMANNTSSASSARGVPAAPTNTTENTLTSASSTTLPSQQLGANTSPSISGERDGPCHLLDLPLEVILRIVKLLLPPPVHILGPFPCYPWPKSSEHFAPRPFYANLLGLRYSCSSLNNILTPAFYTHVDTRKKIMYFNIVDREESQHTLFLLSLKSTPSLRDYVTTVHIGKVGTVDVHPVFWLPNIHTIFIPEFESHVREFGSQERVVWPGTDPKGTSSVKVLHLMRCEAGEAALQELLSWPKELKELYYELEFWNLSDDPVVDDFTCEAFQTCLLTQINSLEKLVFIRDKTAIEELQYDGGINLSNFQKLKTLITTNIFLTPDEQTGDVARKLPPNLEELQVDYDNADWVDFYTNHGTAFVPEWLFDVLGQKQNGKVVPKLERVRIVALLPNYDDDERSGDLIEGLPDHEFCNRLTNKAYPDWRPPTRLMEAFDAARLCYSIYMSERMKYRQSYEGVKDFEEHWEDSESESRLIQSDMWESLKKDMLLR